MEKRRTRTTTTDKQKKAAKTTTTKAQGLPLHHSSCSYSVLKGKKNGKNVAPPSCHGCHRSQTLRSPWRWPACSWSPPRCQMTVCRHTAPFSQSYRHNTWAHANVNQLGAHYTEQLMCACTERKTEAGAFHYTNAHSHDYTRLLGVMKEQRPTPEVIHCTNVHLTTQDYLL